MAKRNKNQTPPEVAAPEVAPEVADPAAPPPAAKRKVRKGLSDRLEYVITYGKRTEDMLRRYTSGDAEAKAALDACASDMNSALESLSRVESVFRSLPSDKLTRVGAAGTSTRTPVSATDWSPGMAVLVGPKGSQQKGTIVALAEAGRGMRATVEFDGGFQLQFSLTQLSPA